MKIRRPSPAEMGLEVTVAIVALTAPYEHFICVSDRMISYSDDSLPADDNALIKNLQLSNNWSVAFAATKIDNVLPILESVHKKITHAQHDDLSNQKLQEHFSRSVTEKIQTEFFNSKLARYGYRGIEQFRCQGLEELGDHFFELRRELEKMEAGVEFIVYGYDEDNGARLFEVKGDGEVIDRMAMRYAVVGSGYWMALAALRRKPLTIDFDSMVYRILEAKFTAETGRVGRPTTVTFKRRNQHDYAMNQNEIEKIRAIWEVKMCEYEPVEALKIAGEIGMRMRREDKMRVESAGSES
jgi:hypothetical protein